MLQKDQCGTWGQARGSVVPACISGVALRKLLMALMVMAVSGDNNTKSII
jgi:hypothetical protein